MQQTNIHIYLEKFFRANQCDIIENKSGYLIVQLTIDLDKELMNRPFYWHYLEKTGGVPNPAVWTLVTNPDIVPEEVKGEIIHFGSPRLRQIYLATKKLSRYIRLFEENTLTQQKTALYPWLGLNIKISYQSDRTKETLRSFGLNLINGAMMENFHQEIKHLPLQPKIPDFHFTISPMIKPVNGVNRVYQIIQNELATEETSWAESALEKKAYDLKLLHHFYEDSEELPDSYYSEKQAIEAQYNPKIEVSIINGGIFYLSSNMIHTEKRSG